MRKRKLVKICTHCLSTTFVGKVAAEIYRWTHESGKVHFSDRAPVNRRSETVELKINTYESVSFDMSILETNKKVVMYSAGWCGVCEKAKRYCEAHNVAYKEYDVEKSRKGRSDFRKLGAKRVPVILIGKKRMNGFTDKGFQRLYQ